MIVGIHMDPYRKFSPSLQKYEEILGYNNIEHIRLDASKPDFWAQVSNLDLFIFRWRQIDDHHQMAKTIIPIVEKEMGIKCFPNMATCWHYDDKIRQYYLLKRYDFPIVQSWIFWDKSQAIRWLSDADLPVVFKLKGGAGSNNVVLIKSKWQGKKLINRMFGKGIISGCIPDLGATKYKDFDFYKTIHRWGGNVLRKLRDEDISPDWQVHKNYVLFQKFLPNNDYDTRVTVVGDRAYAFRRFNRENDFRSSGSGKIDYNVNNIDENCIKIAFKISKHFSFQSMAYDFLYNTNGDSEFCEISYTYVDSAIYNCPGYWDSNLDWHEGHYWPQYFQLMDALKMPDLKQPELMSNL